MKKNLTPLYNNKIIGVSHIKASNKWRSYINEVHIGNFDSKIEAVTARLTIEKIFKNVLSKLNVKSFSINRDNNFISIEVVTCTEEYLSIKTNILYSNSRENSTKGGELK